VTQVTGPNGAQATTTYDALTRPLQSSIPDGAVTKYTYSYSGPVVQTATLYPDPNNPNNATRWKQTTLDGFGRVTKVVSGQGGTTVSTVETQYAPCACTPLGKMSAVSAPYAPGQTAQWTHYFYDALGRTTSVV